MSRAENQAVPILLLQIKLSSRYIVCRANSQGAAHFWQPNYLGLFRAARQPDSICVRENLQLLRFSNSSVN